MSAAQSAADAAVEPFDAVDVIRTKRDRGAVPEDALRWMIDAYTREYVADSQMAAFAMAVLLNGMNRDEIRVMTDAMIASGERMSFAGLGKRTVDKHSTGGVGDKITLPLAPLVAAFGVAVPQLSGRGLGTPAARSTSSSRSRVARRALQRRDVRAAARRRRRHLRGRLGLAPADKRLYALRDVTGTVEAIPLIASSIMSKKIAEGTDALVLDVKFGSGAFMRDVEKARELARTMVALGTDSGGHDGAADRHEHAARSHHRQRQRGARVGRGARRRRPGRHRRADRGSGARDARPRRTARRRRRAALRDGRAMDAWRR
jgi:thymidine phosphorylase